jgi:hypothetical protein
MIKKYSPFLNESKSRVLIDKMCRDYHITNYKINEDGSVDVNDDVDLSNIQLTKLPIRFGKVSGYFMCCDSCLLTLEGCPRVVGKYFDCSETYITSLIGGPESVGTNYFCYENSKLISLDGCPKHIGQHFDCSDTGITSLIGGPESVGGDFDCYNSNLTSLIGGPKSVGGSVDLKGGRLVSFEGFPERHVNFLALYIDRNPVEEVFNILNDYLNDMGEVLGNQPFDPVNIIHSINEWDVIDPKNMEVSYLRLSEVCEGFGVGVPTRESIVLEHYTLVD